MDFYEGLLTTCGFSFNPNQRKAIDHHLGPALTLAVPGSGKTTLLLARTVHLVHVHGVKPEQILTMTFSKAAALDMEKRYQHNYYKHFKYNLKFSTIHSFCWKILKTYRQKKGLSMTLIESSTEHSKLQILSQIYKHLTGDYLGEEQFEELSNQLGYAKNMMLLPGEFIDHGLKFPQLAALYSAYEQYKYKHNALDFDDLLSETLKAIQTDTALLNSIRQAYPFVQVDETQDTSKLQHEIIKRIAYPENNVFVVADDDQSIYGFRGATPALILDFEKLYPKSALYHLEINYRSKDEILDVCTASINNNLSRYQKKMSGNRGKGGMAALSYFADIDQRNDQIVLEIETRVQSKKPLDMAILYRNNMSAISIVDRLIDANIKFSLKDGKQKTSTKWIVKDIEAFLSLSSNPSNLTAFEKICYRTNARISKSAVDYVRLNHRGRSIFECLAEAPGVNGYKLKILRTLESNILSLRHMNALTALDVLDKEIGYGEFMAYASEKLGYSKIGIQNLWASLKAIGKRQPHLIALLDRLQILDQYISDADDSHGVKLSTIHSSKGQEYDTVILIDINEGLLPANTETSGKNIAHDSVEEDRRLFYVGISRAKETLHLYHARFANDHYISPSIFIKEIEKSLTASISAPNQAEPIKIEVPNHWQLNTYLTHTVFGRGQILGLNGDRIAIGFEDKIRELSIRVCLEKKLLK